MALELQKSASRFPRDTTCLAQGTFVRSIFISLLLSQPISPGHSVRHHLSLTVKLSRVCASVCLWERARVFVCVSASACVRVAVCHVGVPRTIVRAEMSREDECFLNIGEYH